MAETTCTFTLTSSENEDLFHDVDVSIIADPVRVINDRYAHGAKLVELKLWPTGNRSGL